MTNLISCCGINCEKCDARIATLSNDNELRKVTAEKWRQMYNSAEIVAEAINCTGCREEGTKFAHCFQCEIRKCVNDKKFETCADCDKLESCTIVAPIHQYVPETLQNLKKLH